MECLIAICILNSTQLLTDKPCRVCGMETQISIGQSMCLRDNLVQLVGRARALIERIPLVSFDLIVVA